MGRSQRHRVLFANYSSDCKGVAEGAIAPGYTRQIPGPYVQPVGPTAGSPLKGSSLTGPPPATFPAPHEGDIDVVVVTVKDEGVTVTPDAPADAPAAREFPMGPFTIGAIADHDDGLQIMLEPGVDVEVGDTVLIEATGNTSVNGSFEVLYVEGDTVIVDNMIVLSSPIEAKGRLTITG